MHPTWRFVEARIEDRLKVDGEKLVCISLLANPVATPDFRQGLDDRPRVAPFMCRKLLDVGNVATLVARLPVVLALLDMVLRKAQSLQRQRVG